jgi:hypothetical protein
MNDARSRMRGERVAADASAHARRMLRRPRGVE